MRSNRGLGNSVMASDVFAATGSEFCDLESIDTHVLTETPDQGG